MIVLENIPLWLFNDFGTCTCVYHYHVAVQLRAISCAVLLSHVVHLAIDEALALALNIINKLLSMGRITDALEELDTLFALQFLKAAILFDEFLLILRQLHTLQIVEDILLSLAIRINRLQTSQANSTGYVIEDSL